jgi:putative endonuclease
VQIGCRCFLRQHDKEPHDKGQGEKSNKSFAIPRTNMAAHNYYVYILTNFTKSVLYTGVTNNLIRRLEEHKNGSGDFTSRYNCFYLLYWEHHQYINNAIAREKEIKGWRRSKKEALINDFNPEWKFLNEEIQD